MQPSFPSCDIWPTSPPREDVYCDGPTLLHPLVSVAIAPSWSASDMPPMFFACGQECLTDEAYYLAQRAANAGTTVQFSHYDALPHDFVTFYPRLPQSHHVLKSWGSFCREVVQSSAELKGQFTRYTADDTGFKGTELNLNVALDEMHRKRMMREELAKRKPWTGPKEVALL